METGGGEKRFHAQISWLMFVFSIFVIWVHSYNVDLFSGGAQDSIWILADQIENFVSVGLGQIAVPGFFLLSSYLFFRNFSWDKLPGKWKSRGFSVLVPYVVWNIIYYLGYMAASRLLAMQSVVGRDVIPFTVQEIWRAISRYAYAPIFWYLYQLMFLILLSPVLYWIIKNRTRGLVFLAAVMAAVHFHLDTMHPNTDALLYYSFGIFMAVHGRELTEASYGKGRILAGIGNVLMAAICFWRMGKPGADVLWIVMFRFFLPISIWLLFDSGRMGKTRPWMRQSLFLYGIHFILVRVFNKGGALVLGRVLDGRAMAVLAVAWFLLLPAAVVASSYAAARILVRYAPAVWRIFSGGRSLD